jgi:hypothetical protein
MNCSSDGGVIPAFISAELLYTSGHTSTSARINHSCSRESYAYSLMRSSKLLKISIFSRSKPSSSSLSSRKSPKFPKPHNGYLPPYHPTVVQLPFPPKHNVATQISPNSTFSPIHLSAMPADAKLDLITLTDTPECARALLESARTLGFLYITFDGTAFTPENVSEMFGIVKPPV